MGKANKIISIMKGQVTPGALQWLHQPWLELYLKKFLIPVYNMTVATYPKSLTSLMHLLAKAKILEVTN